MNCSICNPDNIWVKISDTPLEYECLNPNLSSYYCSLDPDSVWLDADMPGVSISNGKCKKCSIA